MQPEHMDSDLDPMWLFTRKLVQLGAALCQLVFQLNAMLQLGFKALGSRAQLLSQDVLRLQQTTKRKETPWEPSVLKGLATI